MERVWALPGGKREPGETARQALQREWQEELGCSAVVGRTLWILENNFEYAGETVTQIEFYFLIEQTNLTRTTAIDKSLEFRWFTSHEANAVDMRPAILRDQLFTPPAQISHLTLP